MRILKQIVIIRYNFSIFRTLSSLKIKTLTNQLERICTYVQVYTRLHKAKATFIFNSLIFKFKLINTNLCVSMYVCWCKSMRSKRFICISNLFCASLLHCILYFVNVVVVLL